MRRLPRYPSSLCSSLPIYTPRRANPAAAATHLPRYPLGPQSATCLWFSACDERRSSSNASPPRRDDDAARPSRSASRRASPSLQNAPRARSPRRSSPRRRAPSATL
ncbi:hypothetical protein MCOR02_001620 [Pyricularia oryzae]|nr:hypothetical protein MCOR02_001620 [Pyricularia oryzae]